MARSSAHAPMCGSQSDTSMPDSPCLRKARFEARLSGLTILPCELLEPNGERLRNLALEQARRWQLRASLIEWLSDACRWRNTLVDRIVSAPRPDDPLAADPLLAVTEPFASWLIEGTIDVPGRSAG